MEVSALTLRMWKYFNELEEKEMWLDDRKWKHRQEVKNAQKPVEKEGVEKKLKCDYGGLRKIKILMAAQDQRIKGG